MSALTAELLGGAGDETNPDDWSSFAVDPKSHEICAICCHGADEGRPLLDAYLSSDEFKTHGDCVFAWARKHNGRAAEVRS